MDEGARTLITAKYVMPTPGQLLEKRVVVIEDGQIVGIERAREVQVTPGTQVFELGDAVILPGFVNAHCQLELGHLARRIPYTGSFTGWTQTVDASHRAAGEREVDSGIATGLREVIRGGTTSIGDVATTERVFQAIASCGLRGVVYLDVANVDPDLAETTFQRARERLDAISRSEVMGSDTATRGMRPLLMVGLAPHAPWAVSADLYRMALELMIHRGDRLCTRIAETNDERRLFQTYDGAFVPLIEAMFPEGAPPIRAASSPVAFLAELVRQARPVARRSKTTTSQLRLARPPMLVHAHYLDQDDVQMIASMRAPVVFCPRHHAYFDHPTHPVARLLEREQTVALGTAGLASNDSLSILDELRFLARNPDYADIPPDALLRMATLHGARALGIEDEVGVLAPGMRADLTAIAVPPGTREDQVFAAILQDDGPVTFTMVDGAPLYARDATG